MGRGRSIDPTRRAFLEQQASQFTIEPLPAGALPQSKEQRQLALYLGQQSRMDQLEHQLEKQLGKLLHQERITLRTLLMERIRTFLDHPLQTGG
ncbi:hypothetical protein [Deinococcus cellulosilyticus]|uniref:Uncharacterized protein n=1 Tax=Deinococcus cellulosilyticus (strain DSM 18568 / NBRC 106333 / KACC 11606 / 5516J-15) TaxID=1223518 RepID=A0A511NAP3_DEIC1|nr:hypothetical protein [Deinococcus cellulosilyticus]GEM49899.1 hypothetical protein DC3_55340 [Deinococcus cellulosilyticus NBRC 106333 = KACC 11606]